MYSYESSDFLSIVEMITPNSTTFPLPGSNSNTVSVDHHLYHHLTPNYPFDQYQSYYSFLGFDQLLDPDHQHQHNNNNIYGLGFDDLRYNYPPQNNIISTDKADSISSFTASAPLMLDQTPLTTTTTTTTHHHHHHDLASRSSGSSASASSVDCMSMNKCRIKMKCKEEINKTKREVGEVVAFRTKTELETLDDGYKWRKYGKKMVKSNPNPRNYYKCSSMGCKVKKRIERDREDSRYLITTYEGIHNHQSPSGIIYYDRLPFSLSHGWSNQLQSN